MITKEIPDAHAKDDERLARFVDRLVGQTDVRDTVQMIFLDLAAAAFERVKNNPPSLIHVPQDYHTYINSPDWTERKRRYFEIREKQCALCFTRRNIDLHHIRYSDRGNEPDSDLVAVCRYHHEQFHRMYGVSGDMRREWQEFSGMLRRSDVESGMIEG